jgi:hypothetical protein
LGGFLKVTWRSSCKGFIYAFYTIARDAAGNIEAAPGTPDATTQVKGVLLMPLLVR